MPSGGGARGWEWAFTAPPPNRPFWGKDQQGLEGWRVGTAGAHCHAGPGTPGQAAQLGTWAPRKKGWCPHTYAGAAWRGRGTKTMGLQTKAPCPPAPGCRDPFFYTRGASWCSPRTCACVLCMLRVPGRVSACCRVGMCESCWARLGEVLRHETLPRLLTSRGLCGVFCGALGLAKGFGGLPRGRLKAN